MIIVLHHRDLRVHDHPALLEAAATQEPVYGLYIDEGGEGAAMRWWLQGALEDLRHSYRSLGSDLLFFRGERKKILKQLNPKKIYELGDNGWLVPRGALTNSENKPIRVFTPFWKRFQQSIQPRKPLAAPKKLISGGLVGAPIEMASKASWEAKLNRHFIPSRKAAIEALNRFLPIAKDYSDNRNDPTKETTSLLSPYLAAGLISPHEVYHACREHEPFLRQLVWREFAHYLLEHFPQMTKEPFSPKFKDFPWQKDPKSLNAWQKGLTGYPIIDAGMRQLWETGWMHNRLRMIVGSFLVKDLNISWTEGMQWFWETLIDADIGNNTFGWQWVGGMGPDAAPFFRIFNPILQSKKFDPEGTFIKRYVPELRNLDAEHLHAPWETPPLVLQSAGVTLGKTYPYPIVDHTEAVKRSKALFSSSF